MTLRINIPNSYAMINLVVLFISFIGVLFTGKNITVSQFIGLFGIDILIVTAILPIVSMIFNLKRRA